MSNSNAKSLARTENRGSSSELVVLTVGCVSVATEWRGRGARAWRHQATPVAGPGMARDSPSLAGHVHG